MATRDRVSKKRNINRRKVKISLGQLRALADFCGQEYRKSYGCLGEYYTCGIGPYLPPYNFRNEGYEKERDWVCRGLCKMIADQLPEGFNIKDLH